MGRLEAAQDTVFDAVIIGGGIIGAGVARDASLRGLSVALIEKADFGGGTTSGSTRLIHGGLRYLEMLDFALVRMDLRERETLLRIARHLVKPLCFSMPFFDRSIFWRAKLKAGMLLYDVLSYDRSLPGHRFLNDLETARMEPHLTRDGLQGAAVYYDAQVESPERLTMENIIDARDQGAVLLNYVEATGAIRGGDTIKGVRVRDLLSGREAEIRARVVVNASGPWFDRVAAGLNGSASYQIRMTKGVHLACEPVTSNAVVLLSPIDRRLFFVIPWMGYSWVGTTDTDYTGDPADAKATSEDVDYLMRSAAAFFPSLTKKQIYWTNAGVRALVRKPGSESSVSRLHKITTGPPGLISILGGKITGYRAIAEEATDSLCRELRHTARCKTAANPLPGARNGAGSNEHLARIYGSRSAEVLAVAAADPALGLPLASDYPDIGAQVVHAVRSEYCVRPADFIFRRSLLGFAKDRGHSAVPAVVSLMARQLGWTVAQAAAEMDAYKQTLTGVPV